MRRASESPGSHLRRLAKLIRVLVDDQRVPLKTLEEVAIELEAIARGVDELTARP